MLTSRRVWCGLFVCSLVVVSVFVDPIRDRATQIAFRYSTGTDIRFSHLKLHTKSQLVEFQNLRTCASDDSHKLRMFADQVLLKVDFPKVLDKQFIAPKAKLTNIEINVDALLPQTGSVTQFSDSTWRANIDELASLLQWENICDQCESLLSADDILKEIDAQMGRWLLRSQQILLHASQLTQSIQAFTNPLRHTGEIRRQLQLLDGLAREQTMLEERLAGIDGKLAEQLIGLQPFYDKDLIKLRSQSQNEVSSLRTEMAVDVTRAWATELWSDQAALGHATYLLLQPQLTSSPYDLDIRKLARDKSLISVSEIAAEGMLRWQSRELAFQAKGVFDIRHASDFRCRRDSAWEIEFKKQGLLTKIDLVQDAGNSNWQLNSTCRAVADGQPALDAESELDAVEIFQVAVKFSAGRLLGTAKLNVAEVDSLVKLPCPALAQNPQLTSSFSFSRNSDIDQDWVTFDLGGDWNSSALSLSMPLPDDFVDCLTQTVTQQFEAQRQSNEQQLEKQLAVKREVIRQHSLSKISLAKETLTKHRESLAGMRIELESALEHREGYEYARLPESPVTKR